MPLLWIRSRCPASVTLVMECDWRTRLWTCLLIWCTLMLSWRYDMVCVCTCVCMCVVYVLCLMLHVHVHVLYVCVVVCSRRVESIILLRSSFFVSCFSCFTLALQISVYTTTFVYCFEWNYSSVWMMMTITWSECSNTCITKHYQFYLKHANSWLSGLHSLFCLYLITSKC